jgi:hypothetical protein
VLFLILILAGLTQGIWYLILDETTYQQEFMRYRQFLRISTDLMEAVESRPRLPQAGTYQLPRLKLFPGREVITPSVTLDYSPQQQVQSITVHYKYEDENWQLRRLYLEPPGGCKHPLYQQAALLGYSIGNQGLQLEEPLYRSYSERPLPTTADDFSEGLKGYLYVGKDSTYFIPSGFRINGTGVFYNQGDIQVGAGSAFRDRVWLLSTKNIYLGDNVRLPNAFLFAQGSIKVGRNVEVCGIMIARNNIDMDASSIIRGNEQVVQTFITPSYIP